MLSSTAWESGDQFGQFAALRHAARTMGQVHQDAASAAVHPPGGVAEDAGLAHDVGNLLGALRLYSDLLALPGVLREEHRPYAAELRLLSERSREMVDRLVHHTRDRRPEWADTGGTVLPEVVERCRGLLGKVAGQTVEVSYGAGAFEPVGVPVESVERILTNLVKNAAEASPWVGAIEVNVSGSTGVDARRRVALTVRDHGCGMDEAAARRLMGSGVAPADGRGLGFRVVRELAAISGGCLTIESRVNVGTVISAEWYALAGCDLEMQETGTATQGEARSMTC